MQTQERIKEQYAQHLKDFVSEIQGLDTEGIPAPHIPIAGTYYDECRYKMAFMGMETYGWASMSDLIDAVNEDPGEAAIRYKDWLQGKSILGQVGNATFFGFIVRFLERFYNLDHDVIYNKQNPHPVLTSFLWGETNAIERYEVTAKPNGVDIDVWNKVKESSKRFDSINHIIEAAAPKVVFVTYKWVNEKYLLNEKDIVGDMDTQKFAFSHQPDPNVPYRYYYLREQDTHVFVLPHPRWIGLYSGIGYDGYIDSILKVMKDYKIWVLPKSEDDWHKEKISKSSSSYKYRFIAELANLLIEKDLRMSGQELQFIFNRNNIKTTYGCSYGEDGGRGIHKVIASAWRYYEKKGDVQTALNIARAFTGKYGNYTY